MLPDERATEFLPPEPAGPAPEIGSPPPQPSPPQQPAEQPQAWPQQPWQQPWGYPPQPPQPDNGAAVAGFVTSLCAAGLLVMSFGFLGLITAIAAPFGIFYSHKGKRAVDEGKTPKHRGLAQAGFVIGIVTLVLSLIATVIGIIFIVAFATDEGFRNDFENNGGGFDSTGARALLLAVRLALRWPG